MHAVTMRMYEREGPDGVAALVIALARYGATATAVLCRNHGELVESHLDAWELHKLEQHAEDVQDRVAEDED